MCNLRFQQDVSLVIYRINSSRIELEIYFSESRFKNALKSDFLEDLEFSKSKCFNEDSISLWSELEIHNSFGILDSMKIVL